MYYVGHPTQSSQNQASQALLSMYMEIAGEEDKKTADSWKEDADGILIFVSPNNPLCTLYTDFKTP